METGKREKSSGKRRAFFCNAKTRGARRGKVKKRALESARFVWIAMNAPLTAVY